MRQRTITAFFFAAVMLGGIYGGKYTFFALFAFITAGCAWELMGMLLKEEERFVLPRKIIGALIPLCTFLSVGGTALDILPVTAWISPWVLLSLLFFGLATMEMFMAAKNPFANLGAYLLTIFYLGIPFALLTYCAQKPHGWCTTGTDVQYYPNRVLGLLLLVWTNDTGAYLFGRKWGKHKLFERISPKKTWEGTIGGGIFAMLGAWGLSFLITDFSLTQWLALSLVAAVGSNLGDLIESMLKRSVGVKDSGTILPGHGGFLDRFDAFIFCLPFYWLVLSVVA